MTVIIAETSGTEQARAQAAEALKAPIASPALTGTPTAPTAAVDTNTLQLSTTGFVLGQAGSATPSMAGTAAAGTSLRYSRADHVHPTDTSRSPLAGSTSLTTLGTITTGVWNGTVITATYIDAAIARLASPTFTGTVSAKSTTSTWGYISAVPGNDTGSGYIEIFPPDGTRNGYIGFATNAQGINYVAERGGHQFSGQINAGVITANTPANTSNDTTVATTAFVKANSGTYFTPTMTNRPSTTTDTVITTFTLPTNDLVVGKVYRVLVMFYISGGGTSETFRTRMGTAGTTADAQVVGDTFMQYVYNNRNQFYEAIIRCTAAGVSGTAEGGAQTVLNASANVSVLNSPVTVNTTASLIISVSSVAGTAQTLTVQAASLTRLV